MQQSSSEVSIPLPPRGSSNGESGRKTPQPTNNESELLLKTRTDKIKAVIIFYEKKFQFPIGHLSKTDDLRYNNILETIRDQLDDVLKLPLEEFFVADPNAFIMLISAFFGRFNGHGHSDPDRNVDAWIDDLTKGNEGTLIEDPQVLRDSKFPLHTIMLMCSAANSMAEYLEKEGVFYENRIEKYRTLKTDLEGLACQIIESIYYKNPKDAMLALEMDYLHALTSTTCYQTYWEEKKNGLEIMAIAYKANMMKFLSLSACTSLMRLRYSISRSNIGEYKPKYNRYLQPTIKYTIHIIFRIIHIFFFCKFLVYQKPTLIIFVDYSFSWYWIALVIIAKNIDNFLSSVEPSTHGKWIFKWFNFQTFKNKRLYGLLTFILIIVLLSLICCGFLKEQETAKQTELSLFNSFYYFISICSEFLYYIFFAIDTISILNFFPLSNLGFCLHVFKQMVKTVRAFILIFLVLWLILVVIYTSITRVIIKSNNTFLYEITRKGTFELFGEVTEEDRDGELLECQFFNRTILEFHKMDYVEASCIFRTTVVPFLFFGYIFFTGILFLNLLTAKLTNDYEIENEKSKHYDGYRKYEQLAQIESALLLPPPFTYIYIFIYPIALFCEEFKEYSVLLLGKPWGTCDSSVRQWIDDDKDEQEQKKLEQIVKDSMEKKTTVWDEISENLARFQDKKFDNDTWTQFMAEINRIYTDNNRDIATAMSRRDTTAHGDNPTDTGTAMSQRNTTADGDNPDNYETPTASLSDLEHIA